MPPAVVPGEEPGGPVTAGRYTYCQRDRGTDCERRQGVTTIANEQNTALLVVGVQNGVVAGAHERAAVAANVGSLVEKARREQGSPCLGSASRRASCGGKRCLAGRP